MRALVDAIRAYPTLLRIGFAEMVAYRAEMLVWMLSTTMPLVNLALWHALAKSGPVAGYDQKDFIAYFLVSYVIRQVTGSWVVWEMNQEMRSGRFSMRLLRPIHPLIAYSAENLAALPFRGLMALPVVFIAFAAAGGAKFTHSGWMWLAALAAIFGAWLITFLFMALLGTMGFFLEQSTSLMYIYLAFFYGASGYFFPLEFVNMKAPAVGAALHRLPFYFQTGFPIEIIIGRLDGDPHAVLAGLGVQWSYVLGLGVATALLWRAGVRRWNAYGA